MVIICPPIPNLLFDVPDDYDVTRGKFASIGLSAVQRTNGISPSFLVGVMRKVIQLPLVPVLNKNKFRPLKTANTGC